MLGFEFVLPQDANNLVELIHAVLRRDPLRQRPHLDVLPQNLLRHIDELVLAVEAALLLQYMVNVELIVPQLLEF